MIPKIIHYCWFGGKSIPENLKRCMDSWKKKLPDYQIMEWNEDKFDINSHPFVKIAYDNRKFAFVSDYVRVYALLKYGGIYLDTDIEICKSFDNLLEKKAFLAIEPETNLIATCCLGFQAEHPFLREILARYDTLKLDMTPNTQLFYDTLIEKYSIFKGKAVELQDICVLDRTFISLYPKKKDNYVIHYCDASWLTPFGRKKQKIILYMLNHQYLRIVYKLYKHLKGK